MSAIITVVIPVYNGEKYVRRAVESVVMQPKKDTVEVLIINDGSKDQSGRICDNLAEEYSNVRVIHKENGGVSSARNLGIQNVKTKYIAFLDCDDWWEPDFLDSPMVEEFSKEDSADVYQFAYKEVCNNLSLVKYNCVKEEAIYYSASELGKYNWEHHCSFIYKLSLLDTYNVYYPSAKVGEDEAFAEMVLFHARLVRKINKCIFNYWENYSSCVHTTNRLDSKKEQYLALKQEEKYLEKYKCSLDADVSFVWGIANNLPHICAENDYQTVIDFMESECFPILDQRPDIRFRDELWSRLEAWRTEPKKYWLKNKICIGIPLRLKQICYQIPLIAPVANYVYNRYHRKYVPYKK